MEAAIVSAIVGAITLGAITWLGSRIGRIEEKIDDHIIWHLGEKRR